jgi:hypothetical protein
VNERARVHERERSACEPARAREREREREREKESAGKHARTNPVSDRVAGRRLEPRRETRERAAFHCYSSEQRFHFCSETFHSRPISWRAVHSRGHPREDFQETSERPVGDMRETSEKAGGCDCRQPPETHGMQRAGR